MVDTIGGRRFLAVMACGAATTALCACGKVSADIYLEAIKWTIVPFVMGNTIGVLAPYLPKVFGHANKS